ncbi:MAG TPA: hypothetical protein VFI02_18495, partial [Armatimonadota bacterium]|nr:hypothetical protein [Armatimonadota bacterium]
MVVVRGTAVTLDGTPVKNVNGRTMAVSGKEGPMWASDKAGKFVIHLPPGTYKLWTLGAKSKAVTLVVPKGKSSVSVKVIAKKIGDRLPLKFVSPDGKPVANARMGAGLRAGNGAWGGGPSHTDASGIMTEVLEYDAPVSFFFAAPGIGYARLDIEDDQTLFSETPIVVQLQSGPYVSGRVKAKSTGMPLGGVKIYPDRVYRKGDPWHA